MDMSDGKYNLFRIERETIEAALAEAGSIVEASALLGITRHSLKRRIIYHRIEWPRRRVAVVSETANTATATAPSPVPIFKVGDRVRMVVRERHSAEYAAAARHLRRLHALADARAEGASPTVIELARLMVDESRERLLAVCRDPGHEKRGKHEAIGLAADALLAEMDRASAWGAT